MMHRSLPLFATAALTCATLAAVGDEAAITSRVISGGGGSAGSANYSLTGTLGQLAIGSATSADTQVDSGFWPTSLELILPPPDESFTAWMEALADDDKPPPDERGPFDEPAGDGLSNLLKYALGLLPLIPAAEAAPRITFIATIIDGVPRDYFAIELERSTTAAVQFQLESSTDLAIWADAALTTQIIEVLGDNRERVRLLSNIAISDQPAHFIRLRIDPF